MNEAEDFLTSLGVTFKEDDDSKKLEEYDIWIGRNKIEESVLDPIHKTLAKDVWTEDQKLKKKHRDYMLNTLNTWLEKMDIDEEPKNVVIIGSITTYQYSKYSDIDVNVVIDISEEKRKELIKFLPNETPLPDTNHPVNYYLAADAGENVSKKTSAYDVLEDKWIRKPKSEKVSYPYSYVVEIAKFFMDGIDDRISEYERDKKELDMYKEYRDNENISISDEEAQKAIEQKSIEIKADLDALHVAKKLVKSFRKEAFENDFEPDFLIDIKTKNRDFSINNLVYKAIERFGYLDKLDKYDKEREKFTQ
jgi:hypothetical protein